MPGDWQIGLLLYGLLWTTSLEYFQNHVPRQPSGLSTTNANSTLSRIFSSRIFLRTTRRSIFPPYDLISRFTFLSYIALLWLLAIISQRAPCLHRWPTCRSHDLRTIENFFLLSLIFDSISLIDCVAHPTFDALYINVTWLSFPSSILYFKW